MALHNHSLGVDDFGTELVVNHHWTCTLRGLCSLGLYQFDEGFGVPFGAIDFDELEDR